MNRLISKILICAGVLLILISGGLLAYSLLEDYQAGLRAHNLLEQVFREGWELEELEESVTRGVSSVRAATGLVNTEDEQYQDEDEEDQENGGYVVIGILEIPALDILLPVLNRTTYALLDISACRFAGSVDEKPKRLVIAGHNLRSHFGGISSLSPGDEISFTTPEGAKFYYSLIRTESVHMSNAAAVQEGDDWEITLLTCQRDRTMRTLARFK